MPVVKLIRIDGPSPVELGRYKTRAQAITVASLLVGLGGHWSSDKSTLIAPDGARYKIVTKGKDDMFKFKVNQGALNDRIAWAREARSMTLEALVKDIKHFHGIQWRTPCTEFLLEMERRLQHLEGLEPHEGPSARAWAEALGIGRDLRHPDCEGLQEFNHGFSRSGSLWGVIKMLDCAAGGSPPTTEQFLDRERSGEWYPRSCR